MDRSDPRYAAIIAVLRKELIPAMGCTEPIAIAYAAARARDILGRMPESVEVGVSGSIIKNVKSVIVPNTGHLKGIEAAVSAGIAGGKAEKKLQVIAQVTPEQIEAMHAFMKNVPIRVEHLENGFVFEIAITVRAGADSASVRIVTEHTNIVHEEKNGVALMDKPIVVDIDNDGDDSNVLTMESIWDFATTADMADVAEILDRQIECNMAIAEEGLRNSYGANIGKVLMKTYGDRVENVAKATAAAGSDARMNGCEMPVIINSGSGNQGMTASVPVVVYARHLGAAKEKLYRALCISNLTAIHQKSRIGRLSAYCGAVNAGAGAGCGIAYLLGGDFRTIAHTLVNALAIVSGIVCDGAKASCAAKIAAAVDAGLLGYHMFMEGQQFRAGDGIVGKGVEASIANVGRLGKQGMKQTNDEIIDIMIGG